MKIYSLAILLILLSACEPVHPVRNVDSKEKIGVPPFKIKISLSEAAWNKLQHDGETIKGAIYFAGDGKPLPNEKPAPFRDVFLGSFNFEINLPGEVIIKEAKISKEAFSRLSDKNYHYCVNVYSGRRVYKDNVLNGGYAQGRASELDKDKIIEVHCDLL